MLPCKEPESSPTTKKHTATHTRYKPDLNLNGSENIKTNVQLARLNLLFYFEGFIAFNHWQRSSNNHSGDRLVWKIQTPAPEAPNLYVEMDDGNALKLHNVNV